MSLQVWAADLPGHLNNKFVPAVNHLPLSALNLTTPDQIIKTRRAAVRTLHLSTKQNWLPSVPPHSLKQEP